MKMIGITGQTGVGKTLLTKEFENIDTLVIDVDEISRKVSHDNTVLQQTIDFLFKKYGNKITHSQSFWELLMSSRKNIEQLEDPLWKEIEKQIDIIIDSSVAEKIVLDYALLPKTKYFDLCSYTILLLPSSDDLRKQSVLKRDNLANTERLDRRDKYNVDYRNYKFNKIAINSYDKKQFSSLRDSILEELEFGNIQTNNYIVPKEI